MNYKYMQLKDALKSITYDQDKVVPPEVTVRVVREKLNRNGLAILERTARIDNGRLDIPVYVSVCGRDAMALTGTTKQMGKGAVPSQAEASALMELAERFSFFSFRSTSAHFLVDTHRTLCGPKISFSEIARSVNDASDDLAVSRSFFEDLPLRWTWAHCLTEQRPVLIPFDWFFTINQFNGAAAGNCLEEALLQGLCEIVERHVCAVVCRDTPLLPQIFQASAADAAVRGMLDKFDANGIRICLSDFSLGMGISTIGVLAWDPETFPIRSEIVWTAGTAPHPEKALGRALSETAQLAGDFNTGATYEASGLPKVSSVEEVAFLTTSGSRVSLQDLPDLSDHNIKTEVERCVMTLGRQGMNVYAVDTMHRDLAIPACYTFIPGARFRERAAGSSVAMFCAKMTAERLPPEAAVKKLIEMDTRLPGKYFHQFYIGTCHLAMGAPNAALAHFHLALDLSPCEEDLASIYVYIGICYKDTGRYHDALAVLRRAADADAERTDVYNLMGYCHYKRGEYREAIAQFKKVLLKNPSSAIDYANIGSNYQQMKDSKRAVHYYELALKLDPGIDFARRNLDQLKSRASG